MGVWDFLTADYQTRQARTRALNQGLLGLFNGITPGLGDRVSSANALINPIDQMGEAGANTVVAFDPSYPDAVRRQAAINAGIGTVTAAAPAFGAAAIGAPARRGIMETLANITGPADDAGRRFLADESGSVPLGRIDPVTQRGDEVIDLLSSGRAAEVTDEMLDMGDPVLNARLDQYLFNNYDLPMDHASRMARGDGKGFDADLYTGSHRDIRGVNRFDGEAEGGAGVLYSSDEARVANTYATPRFARDEGGQVLPLRGRVGGYREAGYTNPFPVAGTEAEIGDWLRGLDAYNSRMAQDGVKSAVFEQRINAARNSGEPGVVFRQTVDDRIDSMMSMPSDVHVTLDPTSLRSRFARFDPRLSHLRNLSAGLGGVGLLGYIGDQQQDNGPGYLPRAY